MWKDTQLYSKLKTFKLKFQLYKHIYTHYAHIYASTNESSKTLSIAASVFDL